MMPLSAESIADADSSVGIPAATLQVIGAGLCRTGTTSLRQALVRLGFGPCDHMEENFDHPHRFPLWGEVLRCKQAGMPIDWRPLLDGYQGIVDLPGAYFWRELTATHPRAKVILTLRDPERWYDSTLKTVYTHRDGPGLPVRTAICWDAAFNGRFSDRAHALATFAAHNQDVRESIAEDRLLVFDVKEGWGPLCAFFGVPVPENESFPHLNEGSTFLEQFA
jgi:hypothetical protein